MKKKESNFVKWLKKEIKETINSLVIALILALIIRAYVVQAFSIPSGSMESTLQIGDHLLAEKITYKIREPKRKEIIIFKFPPSIEKRKFFDLYFFKIPLPKSLVDKIPEPEIAEKKKINLYLFKMQYPQFLYVWRDFIKRVIAIEGDKIEIKNGTVYVNDKSLNEPYILEKPDYEYGPKKVPKNCLFVLGDNRNNSEDSHVWDFLNKKYLRGKALVIYWPIRRIGLIK